MTSRLHGIGNTAYRIIVERYGKTLLAAVFFCTLVSVTAGISAGRAIGGIRGRNVGRIAEIAGGAVLTVIGLTFLF